MSKTEEQCNAAKLASYELVHLETATKNNLLTAMAAKLRSSSDVIIAENQKDIQFGKENGLSDSLIDRLSLDKDRIEGIATSLETIQELEDPIHQLIEEWNRPNGLKIQKIRVPFGVIGIIYEARPNVTIDAIGLALKSGNAIVLRGSSSAYHSNKVLSDCCKDVLRDMSQNADAIQLLEDTSRDGVIPFVKLKQYLDLVIPRGSAGLINTVVDNATVPYIETGVGNCHVYVDQSADMNIAESVMVNSATQRVSVCNSTESVLLHKDLGDAKIKQLISALLDKNVEVRGCEKSQALDSNVKAATDSDWGEEFLDMIVSCKVVDSIDDAIGHITEYGSMHTECIIATDKNSIQHFAKSIDASSIISNASTRFTDGGEFGFGAEMGISTQKSHARGPMGLKELTTYKYVITGDGQLK